MKQLLIFLLTTTSLVHSYMPQSSLIGLFTPEHPRLEGIIWGNWGSRPYEYAWVSNNVNMQNKRVIDLGVGLPSQYTWYRYVIETIKPSFYAAVDIDDRIIPEQSHGDNFEIRHMNMTNLAYSDVSFDIALCISTFEHIPYKDFMQSIREAHRVLKDDGILMVTLDEHWEFNQPIGYHNGWNTLEQSLHTLNTTPPFSLPQFLMLIADYFVPIQENIEINVQHNTISDTVTDAIYYQRTNKDETILHSGHLVNSCVSYVVLKKISR